jgi:DNA-binding response OmpR family regulator
MKKSAAASHPQHASEFATPPARIGETATLLVVDDDPAVRSLEVELLSAHGYNVLQAEGAAEALRLATATAAIHLLVTDFSMPETNGLELARRFRAVHPKTPVLMVSGSLPEIHPKANDLERFAVLGKPFKFDELLHKVHALLAEMTPLPLRTN